MGGGGSVNLAASSNVISGSTGSHFEASTSQAGWNVPSAPSVTPLVWWIRRATRTLSPVIGRLHAWQVSSGIPHTPIATAMFGQSTRRADPTPAGSDERVELLVAKGRLNTLYAAVIRPPTAEPVAPVLPSRKPPSITLDQALANAVAAARALWADEEVRRR